MFEAGVNVGLGSDGAYVNCSMDMVEQMKFAALIQNVTHIDPTLMSAERAIEMATINSAKALGIDHLVGSLEVGKKADIAVFDFEKAHVDRAPTARSRALVFSAHGTDVDTVDRQRRSSPPRTASSSASTVEQEVLAEATRPRARGHRTRRHRRARLRGLAR